MGLKKKIRKTRRQVVHTTKKARRAVRSAVKKTGNAVGDAAKTAAAVAEMVFDPEGYEDRTGD